MRQFLRLWLCALALAPCTTLADPPLDGPALTVPLAPPAFDEGTDPPLPPPALAAPEPILPVPAAAEPALAAPVLPYHEHRFWFVSSRECAQSRKQLGCCGFDYFQADCFGCDNLNLSRIDEAQFAGSLIPGIPVCIVVHGSFVNWNDVTQTACRTHRWLRCAAPDQPLQVVFYSWPSEPITLLPQIDVNVLGRRSARNGFYLSSVLNRVPVESPVSLIGHSHGTRTISALLHALAGGEVEGLTLCAGSDRGHRLRAVFAASALDHDWLNPGDRYGRALGRTESLLVLVNRRDVPLSLYPLRKPFGARALSHTGLTNKDERRLGALAGRVCEADVSRLVGRGHTWPNYFSVPQIAMTMRHYVYFDEAAFEPAP